MTIVRGVSSLTDPRSTAPCAAPTSRIRDVYFDVRGLPLPHADQVRRRRARPRHDPERDDGRSRRAAGKTRDGLRVDAAGQRVGVAVARLTYDQTLAGDEVRRRRGSPGRTACAGITGHPIDITHELEPRVLRAGDDFAAMHQLARADAEARDAGRRRPRSTPPCTTPTARLHGLNCYQHLRPASSSTHDLGHYLGDEFAGDTLDRLRHDRAEAADAAVPPRRGARPAHAGGRDEAGRRRAARTPRRVDRARRPDAPEDQAQRRRPRRGTWTASSA